MIRVTVELISAIHPTRSKVLGTMTIANDGTGSEAVGNYKGTLHAEYTPTDGRTGTLRGFKRSRQSVWSLVGAFLQKWGHMKNGTAPETPELPAAKPPIDLSRF